MTTFKDLFNETEFDKVWNVIEKHYINADKHSISDYKNFFDKLITLCPSENKTNMFIYINVFMDDGNDDYYCPDSFDENDSELYFDVCGQDDAWCGYSLVASPFESWLGYYIDNETLHKLSCTSIVAHCIWEMTFFGFEQKRDEEGSLIIDTNDFNAL